MEPSTTFTARAVDGREYTIIAKRDDHGSELIRTEDGREVKHVSRGVYDVLDGSDVVRVTSDDPYAP
jgi:hypothetical protein